MGIDWERMRLRDNVDPAALGSAIERQAFSFQAMRGRWPWASSDLDPLGWRLAERVYLGPFQEASSDLLEMLEGPGWDEETGRALDDPDLEICRRVPMKLYPTFPPLWRIRALRTLLPDQALVQTRQWRRWTEEVASGRRDEYLRELHLFNAGDRMAYHWSYLRGAVESAIESQALEPDLASLADRILRLPQPFVIAARIDPDDPPEHEPSLIAARSRIFFEGLSEFVALARAWNEAASASWRVPDYDAEYARPFEEFREGARDPWLFESLDWVERCAERGFALYLSA